MGVSSVVQGVGPAPPWDFDKIFFFIFDKLLNRAIRILQNKT
jgi:hypothetical protein